MQPVAPSPAEPLLNTLWERQTQRWAVLFTAFSLVLFGLVALVLARAGKSLWVTLPAAAVASLGVYHLETRKLYRRRQILSQPFPAAWEEVLQREVVVFRALAPEDQQRFRRELQVFLGEKRITGIGTDVDVTTQVIAGASAIIPILGFPDWEWGQIEEVLIYPSRFSEDFSFGERSGHHTLGMVGAGALNRMMILSKPDLLQGFRDAADRRNVGIHEFAHLVDKSDGTLDGLPAVGLDRQAIGPWIELVRREMLEIERGGSDIDAYALTNEAEFFAVVSEYFFERPDLMHKRHPALYEALSRIFQQDLGARLGTLAQERLRGRSRFGRNSPCPCGSGRKYKRCCLRGSRRGLPAPG